MESVVGFDALQTFYRGKNVFITGHTGFKGAWLVSTLHLLGAKIKGYALPPEFTNGLYAYLEPLQLMESVFADIRDKKRLTEEIQSFAPDYIFHLAAQPLVRASYRLPAETFEVNAVGTANLLEAVTTLQHQCTTLVITTDKVYENKETGVFYGEDDRLGGYDPYSASKACTEIVTSSFRYSFFNPKQYHQHQKAVTTARAGNVIGGGDWSRDRILPDIVKALQFGEPIAVRNPAAVRPWQHVLEPVVGYMALAASLNERPETFSAPYNFGPLPHDHLQVKDLVDIAIRVWGSGEWIDISDPTQPHEAGLLQLSIEKAAKDLHWQPRLSAQEAIAWTLEWYKQQPGNKTAFTFEQIKNYLAV